MNEKERFKALNKDHSAVQKNLADAKKDIKKLQSSNEKKTNRINKLIEDLKIANSNLDVNSKGSKVSDDLNKAQKTISSLQIEQKNNLARIDELMTELGKVNNKRKTAEENIAAKELEYSVLKKNIDADMNEVNGILADKNSRINDLKESIKKAKGEIETSKEEQKLLTEKLSVAMKNMKEYEDERTEIAGGVASLFDKVNENEVIIYNLKKGYAESRENIQTLNNLKEQLEAANKIQLVQIGTLMKRAESAENKLGSYEKINNEYSKKLAVAEKEIKFLKEVGIDNNVKAMKNRVNLLVAKNRELLDMVSELNRRVVTQSFNRELKGTRESRLRKKNKIKHLLSEANKASVNRNYKKAVSLYDQLLIMEPDNFEAQYRCGISAMRLKEYDKAEKYFEAAAYIKPDDIGALSRAGYCYLKSGDLYKALSAFSKAASLEPGNPQFLSYLGIICGKLGWSKAAIDNFKKSMEVSPKSADTAYNLAMILAMSNPLQLAEAEKWYRKALKNGAKRSARLETLFKSEKKFEDVAKRKNADG